MSQKDGIRKSSAYINEYANSKRSIGQTHILKVFEHDILQTIYKNFTKFTP